jgi:hypothetical protein
MATSMRKSRAGKDSDKKSSKKIEDEVLRVEEVPVELVEQVATPVVEEQIVQVTPQPPEPEPEPVYDEPILTKLIVERCVSFFFSNTACKRSLSYY